METEAVELRVEVHVDEGAVFGGCYARFKDAGCGGDAAGCAVVSVALDVGC